MGRPASRAGFRLVVLASVVGMRAVIAAGEPITLRELSKACGGLSTAESAGKAPPPSEIASLLSVCRDPIADLLFRPLPSVAKLRKEVALIESALQVPAPFALGGTPKNLTGLDQSALLWGLTDVIVKRGGEELQGWVLDQFRRDLCPADLSTRPEFRVGNLLPRVCSVLGPDDYVFAAPGGLLSVQRAFRADLRTLPATVSSEVLRVAYCIGDSGRSASGAPCQPGLRDPLHALAIASAALQREVDGASVLATIAGVPVASCPEQLPCFQRIERQGFPATALIYDAALVVEALYDPSGDAFAPTPDALARALVVKAAALNADDRRPGWAASSPLFASLASIDRVWSSLDDARSAVRELRDLRASPQADSATQRAAYARAAESVFRVCRVSVEEAAKLKESESLDRTIAIARLLEASARSLAEGDYVAVGFAAAAVSESLVGGANLDPTIRRVLGLGADLAQARDAASVASVLDAYVAPAGTSKGKRLLRRSYVVVNAYAGAFVAAERIPGET
ncbi:MAG: hypothetical protein DYH06_13780, partial [Acidobacteria bacterium ACB2]|nr:hypothetical protein [Acidobacteria bacterium ACB2]